MVKDCCHLYLLSVDNIHGGNYFCVGFLKKWLCFSQIATLNTYILSSQSVKFLFLGVSPISIFLHSFVSLLFFFPGNTVNF